MWLMLGFWNWIELVGKTFVGEKYNRAKFSIQCVSPRPHLTSVTNCFFKRIPTKWCAEIPKRFQNVTEKNIAFTRCKLCGAHMTIYVNIDINLHNYSISPFQRCIICPLIFSRNLASSIHEMRQNSDENNALVNTHPYYWATPPIISTIAAGKCQMSAVAKS